MIPVGSCCRKPPMKAEPIINDSSTAGVFNGRKVDNRSTKILDLSHDLFYLCHDIKLNFAFTCTSEGQTQYTFFPLTDIFPDFAHIFAKCAKKKQVW